MEDMDTTALYPMEIEFVEAEELGEGYYIFTAEFTPEKLTPIPVVYLKAFGEDNDRKCGNPVNSLIKFIKWLIKDFKETE